MKVLFCHNYYQQTGGEDVSFDDEVALLRSRGHSVVTYLRHNDEAAQTSRVRLTLDTFWSRRSYREVRRLIAEHRPDIVHCTNTFPLISPSVYYAARRSGVPVVQSLRNYRIMCANGLFFRDGKVCEKCLCKPTPWPSVIHRCYRGSAVSSAVVTAMVGSHWHLGTWTRAIDLYITLTHLAKAKFVAAGLPEDRIRVKPNFLPADPGMGRGDGGYALFVGRLSEEKGVATLLEAWSRDEVAMPLRIIGDGPMAPLVREAAGRRPDRIRWLGSQSREQVFDAIGDATCLIVPSLGFETFGRAIMEGFAKGVPVVASRLGAMAELIDDGVTGLHFTPGDADDLLGKLAMLAGDDVLRQRMRDTARRRYLAHFTADANYSELISLYEEAQKLHAARSPAVPRRALSLSPAR